VPVAGLVKIHQALVTSRSVPAHNVADLIALAKKEPGTLNYGTYGVGSTGHLNMEMFQAMAGVQMVAIHYKGATPALTDVIAGHIQTMFISVGSAVQHALTQRVLSEPGFRAAILDPQFFEPMPGLPQDFADFIKTDAEKWRRVMRVANVKLD
jgi:tripartite-type tricarboxylate transporter receptor subunit TctC